MTRGHPGEPGTRACWVAGCVQYECVTAANIDPVRVERHLARGDVTPPLTFTPDEREEWARQREAGVGVRASRSHLQHGQLHYPHAR